MRLFSLVCMALFLCLSAYSAEQNTPLTQEQYNNQKQALSLTTDLINRMIDQTNHDLAEFVSSCKNVIGSESYCTCIGKQTPSWVTYPQYVSILLDPVSAIRDITTLYTNWKEKEPADSASKAVAMAITARDTCLKMLK